MSNDSMHPVDRAIFEDRVTVELLAAEIAKPLPAPGTSYWGDELHRAVSFGVKLDDECGWIAAVYAAHQMGVTLSSLKAVSS